MKHLGDITKIDGHNVPIVDIVTGGSPCQDLSVAGKRAGLDGERSGLFMEQIRVIKEMRNECVRQLRVRGTAYDARCIRPRFMVWENVPGAFSSNKGQDFRAVLEETARIVDKDATIPMPNKWTPSGCIVGNGWSIAWRVHDAQFWGVPQRRKRIALVADFGGLTAPEILFERKGVSGDIEESREEGQEAPGIVRGDIEETISFQERAGCDGGARESSYSMSEQEPCQPLTIRQYCLNDQGGSVMGVSEDVTGALRAQEHGHQPIVYGISSYDSNAMKSSNPNSGIYEAETTRTLDLNGGNPACNQGGMAVVSIDEKMGQTYIGEEVGNTLSARDYKQPQAVVCGEGGQSRSRVPMVMEDDMEAVVRRLTPLECERLQGYPDGWTDIGDWTDSKGKLHKGESDSPRYKALGNSIALPFWEWMAKRMVSHLDTDHPTMASLFDGIGGFPLVFSRCDCDPVWASEIEEFPIAVTKIRFPDKEG